MPRTNHYNLNVTQIFQDEYKVAILYQYHNRWRVIWTDGRELPKLIDGGGEKAGDQVELTLEPAKENQRMGRILQSVLANGKTLGRASSAGAIP